MPKHDDNGLPVGNSVLDPFKDKMKGKIDAEISNTDQAFVEKPLTDSAVHDLSQKPKENSEKSDVNVAEPKPKSWANVVSNEVPSLKLNFYPAMKEKVVPAGTTVEEVPPEHHSPDKLDDGSGKNDGAQDETLHTPLAEWTEVKRKKPPSTPDSAFSPSPPLFFKNLKKVDEVEGKKVSIPGQNSSTKRLTKSQKKKLKASSGSSPRSQP
ncbi:hypothetical protein ACET3Z_025198 [Daucus carota]